MKRVNPKDLQVGMDVYFVPRHLEPDIKNAEAGTVTMIRGENVWVKYLGPQGNLTPAECLYIEEPDTLDIYDFKEDKITQPKHQQSFKSNSGELFREYLIECQKKETK